MLLLDHNKQFGKNIPVFIDGEIIYYYSSNSTCYFNTAPCTHINFFQNSSSQIKLKRKFGYKIFYFEPENLSFLNGKVIALCKNIKIDYNKKNFYSLLKKIHFAILEMMII